MTNPLAPKQEYLQDLDKVLDATRVLYRATQDQTALDEEDYDRTAFDAELWLASLTYITDSTKTPFIWNLAWEDQGKEPVNEYLHSMHAQTDGVVAFNLYEPHMDIGLDFDDFKMVLMRYIEHEAVHMARRDRMGHEMFANSSSGYQNAQVKMDSKDPKIKLKGLQIYLSDPQEVMAFAKDLQNEIQCLSNVNEVIRNPDKYKEHLPTWKRFTNSGFEKNDKVIKRLLKYTVAYLEEEL